jgi:two-component system, OmpR family, manganese sensing sensor histidine kinase
MTQAVSILIASNIYDRLSTTFRVMFQATRRRLAIWYTAVTAVLLLLFATAVYLYVRQTLIERVDDTLNHVVEVVERSLTIELLQGSSTLGVPLRANAERLEDDRIDLEWFSATGVPIWSTFATPLDIPLKPNRNGETVYPPQLHDRLSELQALRQVTARVEANDRVVGYLRVSHPWFEVTKPSLAFIGDLSLGIAAMLVSVATIGWWLAGKAMLPVGESYQRLKQFTADASHELRSPIAAIQTNVQVALADPEFAAQPYSTQLQAIERLTRRLGRLVDDLLFLARQDSGMVPSQRQLVFLDALLLEVTEELQAIADEKKIRLTLHIAEPAAEILEVREGFSSIRAIDESESETSFTLQGDEHQLARLLTNLVENAIQYTPAGGSVEVSLSQIELPPSRHTARSALEVKVKDTGVGIPEAALLHIFDRFYRIDPARRREPSQSSSGSGLGLAIAQAIATNHHGTISIDSQLDLGTTVTVTLPGKES